MFFGQREKQVAVHHVVALVEFDMQKMRSKNECKNWSTHKNSRVDSLNQNGRNDTK
jgi:hypothetical protein